MWYEPPIASGFHLSVIDEEGESKDLLELSTISHSGMYRDGGKGYVPERKGNNSGRVGDAKLQGSSSILSPCSSEVCGRVITLCKINLGLPYASTHANPCTGKYCMYIHTHWLLSRGLCSLCGPRVKAGRWAG